MILLEQSTSALIHIGPILGTNFLTVQTGVTLSSGTAELFKEGSSSAVAIHGNTWAHINGGVYALTLTSSDTNTAGSLLIHIHAASTQPITVRGLVVPSSVYDGMLSATGLPADITKINGSSTAGANLGASALGVKQLTISSGATTVSIPTNLIETENSFFTGRTLVITSGALAGQATTITAYNGSTKTLTVAALTSAPAASVTAVIV